MQIKPSLRFHFTSVSMTTTTKTKKNSGEVVHICNTWYLRGEDRRITSSRPTWTKVPVTTYLKRGISQAVELSQNTQDPVFHMKHTHTHTHTHTQFCLHVEKMNSYFTLVGMQTISVTMEIIMEVL
jgi:hypothetical protein